MSVLKNKRNVSKMEFYHTARRLRREIILLMRRDFGINNKGNAKNIDPALPDNF